MTRNFGNNKGNVEKFEEIKEWHNIVYQGSSVKIQVDEKLLNLIKTNIPDKTIKIPEFGQKAFLKVPK